MGGKQKRTSSSTFSLFGFLKSGKAKNDQGGREYDYHVKAYKVYPSDEDGGRWVADPAIDRKASAYISHTREKLWVDDAN